MSDDPTDEELAEMGAVVVLICHDKHIVLWPADLRPAPDRCFTSTSGWECRFPLIRHQTMVPVSALRASREEAERLREALPTADESVR